MINSCLNSEAKNSKIPKVCKTNLRLLARSPFLFTSSAFLQKRRGCCPAVAAAGARCPTRRATGGETSSDMVAAKPKGLQFGCVESSDESVSGEYLQGRIHIAHVKTSRIQSKKCARSTAFLLVCRHTHTHTPICEWCRQTPIQWLFVTICSEFILPDMAVGQKPGHPVNTQKTFEAWPPHSRKKVPKVLTRSHTGHT